MTTRQLFTKHVCPTSKKPLGIEISHAEGMFIYDTNGKSYMDLNSGISVSSLGHRHPKVLQAIEDQLSKYLHTMVYGEHIQTPQVEFATLLTSKLSNNLNSVYFVNSGSEAVEVAMKVARSYTGRYEIISCSSAYHGSTMGAESLRSDDDFTAHFAPGIPAIRHIDFNDRAGVSQITEKTACVILEPVQAERGVYSPTETISLR